MNSELDRIKSTITISLGTKNKLRELKGSYSYEELINSLLRMRNQLAHNNVDNVIELQKLERKKAVYDYADKDSRNYYTLMFSYNKYNNSSNFWFDIKLEIVRDKTTGRKVDVTEFVEEIYPIAVSKPNNLKEQYKAYFKLLETAIQNEIEPLFRHKGRIEDYFSWKEEFKMLNLSGKSFEEDVMEKLNSFKSMQGAF